MKILRKVLPKSEKKGDRSLKKSVLLQIAQLIQIQSASQK